MDYNQLRKLYTRLEENEKDSFVFSLISYAEKKDILREVEKYQYYQLKEELNYTLREKRILLIQAWFFVFIVIIESAALIFR